MKIKNLKKIDINTEINNMHNTFMILRESNWLVRHQALNTKVKMPR